MSDAHYDPNDALAEIATQERFEESDEYAALIKDWLLTSCLAEDWARDTFPGLSRYDDEFAAWVEGQRPAA